MLLLIVLAELLNPGVLGLRILLALVVRKVDYIRLLILVDRKRLDIFVLVVISLADRNVQMTAVIAFVASFYL